MRRWRVDVACRNIVGDDIPAFRTISDSREIHLARLETLFVEVLELCALAGLTRVGTIALDGSKVKANASRPKAMSDNRMKAEKIRLKGRNCQAPGQRRGCRQGRRPRAWSSEDLEHGPGRQGDERPTNWLVVRAVWRRSMRPGSCWKNVPGSTPARTPLAAKTKVKPPSAPPPAETVPEPKDQINFTAPQARIMKTPNKG